MLNLFDKDLRQDSEDTQKSFFFAGIGDARHLFGTLLAIAEHERDQKENQNSVSYHFTINDLNVLALCRDLIVFMLLEDASRLDEGTPRHADIMNALFFVYVSILMPTYALEVLDDTIDTAITALKNREQPVSWLHIHEPDFPLYIQGLERWMGEARTLCTVDVFLKAASKGRLGSHHGDMSKPLKKESLLYRNASLLYPSRAVLYARDPDLSKILDGLPSKPKATDSRKVRQHVKDNWKPNVTLVDPMWIKGRPENLDIGHDPFDLVDQVDTKYTEQRNHLLGLFDIMEPFFKDITCALVLLRGKMRIEAIHGDCIDLFERLRYDIIPERKQDPANEDGGKWARPVRFDRIHLSNIP